MIGEYAIPQGIACLFFVGTDVRNERHVRRKAAPAASAAPPVRTGGGEGALSVLTDLFEGLHRRGQTGVLFSKFLSSLVLTAAVLAGLAVPFAAAPAQAQQTYLIGPGDVLQVDVRRQEDLSMSVTVRPDGRISMPLVDDLVVLGKTPGRVADEVAERLSEFVIDPLVTVAVVSGVGDPRQQVRVIGEAADPQAFSYRSGMTLLDAIVEAGGLSREADGNGAVIVRQTNASTREIPVRIADLVRDGDLTANVLLEPGDVIVIPEGFFAGEWTIEYRVSASETISDNIDQDPDGEREVGFITRAGPGVTVSGNTARVVASLTADLVGVVQNGGDDEGLTLDPTIAGASTTELSPDLLFFDLSASVSRQLLDTRESSSGSGASTSNRDTVAVLTASPYLIHRLGDIANVEWRYRVSPVLVDSDDNSDVLSQEGSLTLDSGTEFRRFSWDWFNRVGQEIRQDEDNIVSASTDFGVSVPVGDGFALLGNFGYEFRDGDEDEDDNFDGITWRAGFSWQPNRDFSLQATYGRTDDDENLNASLSYQVSAKTSINANYTETLESSQQTAISNLAGATIDPDTGEVIDGDTGLGFDGDSDPSNFDDETKRTRTFRLFANHVTGLNTFGLSGTAGSSRGGSDGDEDFYNTRASWGRTLTDDLSLNSGAGYERSEFDEDNRTEDTYRANLGLSYSVTSNAQASLNYDFELRDSTESDDSFFENAVTLGIVVSF